MSRDRHRQGGQDLGSGATREFPDHRTDLGVTSRTVRRW
ncbi:hypothetical protein FrEUN1fDRAFT_7208 [Parafrankia sp. EUN1f]|nr:hypothetical protein FrEUN1fDRAFT_7208 [Parafrankia sp. EUN1f]